MTSNGLFQIGLYRSRAAAAGEARGRSHGPRVPGRAHVFASGAAASRKPDLPDLRHRGSGRAELEALCRRRAGVQRGEPAIDLPFDAGAAVAAVESAGAGQRDGGPGLEHGGQLHHQYELAGVHAGNHHELSDADGGAGDAQLLLGGSGNCGGDRGGARVRTPLGENTRQFLGGFHAIDRLRAAADLDCGRAAAVLAGSDPEPASVHQGGDARGRGADASARAGGFAGSHQDAGHQRRRIHQRQFGSSL